MFKYDWGSRFLCFAYSPDGIVLAYIPLKFPKGYDGRLLDRKPRKKVLKHS